MPSTYFDVKQIKRSKGRSSVAAAAYRSGENIKDSRQNLTFDYTRKQHIEHTEILTPDNAPEWTQNRAKLWNMVEQSETRKDSQTARDLTISLHEELTIEENKKLIQNYIKNNFVSSGMVADLAIHNEKTADGGQNLHAHIMLTMRELDGDQFSTIKNRDWNKKELVTNWRKSWEELSNQALEEKGIEEQIKMTKDKNISSIYPVKNLSLEAYQMETKGIATHEGEIYKVEVMQFEKQIAHNDNAIIEEKRTVAMGGSVIHKNLYSQALQDLKYEKALEKQQAEKGENPFSIVEDDNETNIKDTTQQANSDKEYIDRPVISWFEKNQSTSLLQTRFDNGKPAKKSCFPETIKPHSFVDELNDQNDSSSDDNINQNDYIFNKIKYYSEKVKEWTTSKFYQEMERLSIKKLLDKRKNTIPEQETKFASVGQGAINENNLHHQKTDKASLKAQFEFAKNSNLQNILDSGKSKTNLVDKIKTKFTDKVESWAEKMGYKQEINNINDSTDINDSSIKNIQIANNIEINKEKSLNTDTINDSKLKNDYLIDILSNNENETEDNEIKDNEIKDNEPRKGR